MRKYRRNALVAGVREETQFHRIQSQLRKRHHIEEENVVVVEKSNMCKFCINTLLYLIRVSASLVWIVLGVTGLAALLYPAPREELMKILVNTLWQIKSYLG